MCECVCVMYHVLSSIIATAVHYEKQMSLLLATKSTYTCTACMCMYIHVHKYFAHKVKRYDCHVHMSIHSIISDVRWTQK